MAVSGEPTGWPLTGEWHVLCHAVTVCRATTSDELVQRTLAAVLDVTGLTAAVVVDHDGRGTVLHAGDERLARQLASRLQRTASRPAQCDGAARVTTSGSLSERSLSELGKATAASAATTRGSVPAPGTVAALPFGAGTLIVGDPAPGRLSRDHLHSVELLAQIAATSLERLLHLHQLRERADADPLTGLGHQRPFGQRLAGAVAGRTAVLAIDVDDFKLVNDTHGHAAGDRLLVDLVDALQGALRAQDELYRVGGDEFAAVVEVDRVDVAWTIADRLVAAARTAGRTVSVGVALAEPGEPPTETMRRADEALYEAKRTGRDRVHRAA